MRWYYIKLGKELEHDLVDDLTLREMAADGRFSRKDLIWPESGGAGWALAETIHGLFPEKKAPLEVTMDQPEDDIEQIQQQNFVVEESLAARKKSRKCRRFILFIVLILGIVCWSYRDRFMDKVPESIKDQLPMPIDHEDLVVAEREAAAELEKAKQEKIITSEKAKLGKLKRSLRDGSLDKTSARELIDLWFEYGDMGQVSVYMKQILDVENGISDATRLSVLTLASAMNDERMIARSINDYKAGLTEASSIQVCLGVVAICNERINGEYSLEVLKAFLEKQHEVPEIWLELAAVQASIGSEKEALESLKTACKTGGKAVKAKARQDKRFDSIRYTSAYRRYTDE